MTQTIDFKNLEHKIRNIRDVIGTRTSKRIDEDLNILNPALQLVDQDVVCDAIQETYNEEQEYMIGVVLRRMVKAYIEKTY